MEMKNIPDHSASAVRAVAVRPKYASTNRGN